MIAYNALPNQCIVYSVFLLTAPAILGPLQLFQNAKKAPGLSILH